MAAPSRPNVYLFVPNLIGYARIALFIAAILVMESMPYTAMACYWLSAFLDAFDGMAARHFDQCSSFGAVLDMVSDRCTTLALLVLLGKFYPDYITYFQLLITLDIGSHWIHMYSALLRHTSHKTVSPNPLLKIYYNKVVLFILCSANELFFMALYLLHFEPDNEYFKLVAVVSGPLTALKHFFGAVQGVDAVRAIVETDVEEIQERRSKK